MKHLKVLFTATMMMMGSTSFAQKVDYHFQATQARSVDTYAHAFVKPMTTELKVTGAREEAKFFLDAARVNDMIKSNNFLDNVRSYAVFMLTDKLKVDAIVAATFNIYSRDGGVEVQIKGFPAMFENWKTATEADYNWIKWQETLTTKDVNEGHAAASIKSGANR